MQAPVVCRLMRDVHALCAHSLTTASAVQAARLKQFVSAQRRSRSEHSGKAEWLLEHRSLVSSATSLDAEILTLLAALRASSTVASHYYDDCLDQRTISQQLLHEEAAECRETAQNFRATARALRADASASSQDADSLLHELAQESEAQWRHVRLLEEDACALGHELRCGYAQICLCMPVCMRDLSQHAREDVSCVPGCWQSKLRVQVPWLTRRTCGRALQCNVRSCTQQCASRA